MLWVEPPSPVTGRHLVDLKEPTTQMARIKSSHASVLAGDVCCQTDECQALGKECFYSDSFPVFFFFYLKKKGCIYNALAAALHSWNAERRTECNQFQRKCVYIIISEPTGPRCCSIMMLSSAAN